MIRRIEEFIVKLTMDMEEIEEREKQKRYLLTQYEWKSVSDKEWDKYFRGKKVIWNYELKEFAECQFKNVASKLGLQYEVAKEVFMSQNAQYYNKIKYYSKVKKRKAKANFKNLLLIPVQTKTDKVITQMKKMSPEELAEIMCTIAKKEIKVVAVDKEE